LAAAQLRVKRVLLQLASLTLAAALPTAVEVRLRPESNARMEDVETAVLRRARLQFSRQTLS